jgi:hypothetical protein
MTRRLDGNRLPVTSRIYGQVGRKSDTINPRLDLTAIHAAGYVSRDISISLLQLPVSAPLSETMLLLTSKR